MASVMNMDLRNDITAAIGGVIAMAGTAGITTLTMMTGMGGTGTSHTGSRARLI